MEDFPSTCGKNNIKHIVHQVYVEQICFPLLTTVINWPEWHLPRFTLISTAWRRQTTAQVYLKTNVKGRKIQKSALLLCFFRFTPFQGLEVERGRANHHRFRRNRKPQKNHSSVRKPLISHCSSERRKRKKKKRCKKKSAVPTFPRPLLIGQSVRKTLISLKMKRNKKKCIEPMSDHWLALSEGFIDGG